MSKSDALVTEISSFLNTFNPLGQAESQDTSKSATTTIKETTHNDITWVHVSNPTKKDLLPIIEKYGIEPFHVQSALTKGQLDRLEIEPKYYFILIRVPKLHRQKNRITTSRISFFVGKKFLITVQQGSHEVISALLESIEKDEQQRDLLFKKSAGFVLYQTMTAFVADITRLHETVQKEVDEIEDLVFDVNVSGVHEITHLRQKIVRLKKVLTPFKNISQELAASKSEITEQLSRNFNYLTNDIHKLRESLEEATEVVEIYKDADFTVSTERTNRILGVLTIIFTLGIPATIVGSFYGMNVLLPGGIEAGSWMWFGPYTTFYIVLACAVVPALIMLILFKHKKWF